MSDEAANPVVQEETKPEISTLAEETTPTQDENQVEVTHEEPKTIPKERFDQVWARSKKAEEEARQLREEIQREREERIRLEERAKAQKEAQEQPEYTWEQLDNFIAEGRITQAQAREYKEKALEKRLEAKLNQQKQQERSHSQVLGEIDVYKSLIPEVVQYGTEARTKVEREYAYLVRNGAPDNYSTQLAALRAAFGDPETIKARNTTKQVITPKEPFMETHTPSTSGSKPKVSFKDSLPAYKREHYEKMIKHSAVKDWKAAEEIEKYESKLVRR